MTCLPILRENRGLFSYKELFIMVLTKKNVANPSTFLLHVFFFPNEGVKIVKGLLYETK